MLRASSPKYSRLLNHSNASRSLVWENLSHLTRSVGYLHTSVNPVITGEKALIGKDIQGHCLPKMDNGKIA